MTPMLIYCGVLAVLLIAAVAAGIAYACVYADEGMTEEEAAARTRFYQALYGDGDKDKARNAAKGGDER